MERYFQPFQDLSDHDLENGGDSAAHTVVFEVSALGFNGKGWKNHSAYRRADGSDHTVGNNDGSRWHSSYDQDLYRSMPAPSM